jgi:NTE family protein
MRAIVFSGGGGKACYQVGALKHLVHNLGRDYDIICGNSAGAINAALMAQGVDPKKSLESLESVWNSITPSHIYQNWYGRLLGPLPVLWKESAYDSSPLHKLLKAHINPGKILESGKKLSVGAVSTTTGLYRTWNEHHQDELVDAIIASSAYPMVFLPVHIGQDVYFDGGVSEYTPLHDAVLLGATEIDAVVLTEIGSPLVWNKPKKAIDYGRRALELIMHQNDSWGVRKIPVLHEHVKVNVLTPSRTLGSFMDFRPASIQKNMQQGYEDAAIFFKE